MNNSIQIAIHKPTGNFIHVDSIESSDKEIRRHCYCLKCGEKLEAVLEFKDKLRTKFFRHHTNPHCDGSQETALHELGKQILTNNSQITIRDHGRITYSNPIAEKRFETIKPDVLANFNGELIIFEIFVSHAVDSGKEKFLINRKIKSIEINLSKCISSSFKQVEQMILEQTELQTIFYWEDKKELDIKNSKTSVNYWLRGVLAAGLVILVGLFIKKKRR